MTCSSQIHEKEQTSDQVRNESLFACRKKGEGFGKFMLRSLDRMLLVGCFLLVVLATQAIAQDYIKWNLPEGARARLGKGGISGSIAYSPDGTRLAVASSIGIWLYDAATLQEVSLISVYTDFQHMIAFSPDGRTLASAGDTTVHWWDVATGQHKRRFEHGSGVTSIAFSPDGRTFASGSLREIRLRDAVTGEYKFKLTRHTSFVRSIAFSPDGSMLASGGGDKVIHLRNAITGEFKRRLSGHTGSVNSVAFSPDGRTLASASGGEIHLWNAVTGRRKETLTPGSGSVAFSPDGRTLASGEGITIRLRDVVTNTHKHTLTGHTGGIRSVVFNPDGSMLASGSNDSTVRLWDAVTGQHKHTLTGHVGTGSGLAFSPDSTILASGNRDDTISLWDAVTGQHKDALAGHTDSVSSLAFSPDGSTLASGSEDKTIRLWDAVTGQSKDILIGHTSWISSVAFSPDGRSLISGGGGDWTVRLWDVMTGENKHTLIEHTDSVSSVAFSPDGTMLASGSSDNTVRLWDVMTGENRHTLTGHTDSVSSVAFSPDGTMLASGSRDETIRLWDAVTGKHKDTLTEHTSWISSVAFSPDGSTLASGSQDIRLWAVATATPKGTFTGHANDIYSVAFSPNGRTLASGGDGTVLLWKITPSVNTTVRISPSPASSPAIGEQLTLFLNIADGENVVGYQATVHFDRTAIRYVESANGDYLPAGAFFVPPVVKRDRVTLGATSLAGVSNGDGTLATLTFVVVDVKASTLTLSEVLLTGSDGEPSLPRFIEAGLIEPTAIPSAAVVSVTPTRVLSPAIGEQLVFNVDITDGQNVAEHQLTWEFDNTALKYLSSSQGDYLAGGVGNGDGRLMTGTFEVLAVKASTVSVSGYLTASNGLRSIPTFESAEVVVPLLGDVNRDGTVNILDLILVASSFGQPVPAEGNPADVNEDGVVNIVDLVKVAGAFNNMGAAPSAHPETLTMLTTTNVKQWLTQAQELDRTDIAFQRGIIFLEQLLAALTPKETELLSNYPNPFNPETWLPYHLAHDADVTLTIYDIKGALVRQLDLGHQPAGYYTTRTRAAYWDGSNSLGEVVGSGVYFYQLSAGDFSATRKMVILK